jgi:hypothetical protein
MANSRITPSAATDAASPLRIAIALLRSIVRKEMMGGHPPLPPAHGAAPPATPCWLALGALPASLRETPSRNRRPLLNPPSRVALPVCSFASVPLDGGPRGVPA